MAHHERYDGKGYPNALSAKRLSIGAQIIAVADTLDAMTSDRPYRKALPVEEAMRALRLGSGTQFNPDVVAAVERLIEGGNGRGALLITLPRAGTVSAAPPSLPSLPQAAMAKTRAFHHRWRRVAPADRRNCAGTVGAANAFWAR